ncbi:MAG: lamin tail domain-containing protein [Euryarchaeota archaeon]|nr:lamin tail domain-containing protein [Euryarchaeota archaeon]
MTKRAPSVRKALGDKVHGLPKSDSAQMAFSMIAVVILLVAGIAVTTITSNAFDSSSDESGSTKSSEMERFAADVERIVSDSVYIIGLDVLNGTYLDDPDAAQVLFQEGIGDSIEESFPMSRGSYVASIGSYSLYMAQMPAAGYDVLSGTLGSGSSNLNAFFRVCGTAELNITCPQGNLFQNITIDRPIYFPLPLLENVWERFSSLLQDSGSLLWKMVRYEVTALVQMRLYQTTTLDGQGWSGEILTEIDVQNAIVLSTVLLQRAVFSTYDEALLNDIITLPGCDIDAIGIVPLIETEGVIDPADLFLILYGMDSVDVRSLIAQSLYASADIIALRLLDYLRVAEVIGSVEKVMESGVFVLRDVISFVLGKDQESENARNWVEHKFDVAGIPEGSYRFLWDEGSDWVISVPTFSMMLINGTGGFETMEMGGEIEIDISTLDVLSSDLWEELRREYQLATEGIIGAIEGMVKSISTEISSTASIDQVTIEIDPFDGISVFDELIRSISTTFDESEGYFKDSSSNFHAISSEDPMGMSIYDSIEGRSKELYRFEQVIGEAYDEMAKALYEDAVTRNPSMDQAPIEYNLGTLGLALQNGIAGNTTAQLELLFQSDVMVSLSLMKEGLTSPSGSGLPFWDDVISTLISGNVMNAMGVEPWIERGVIWMLEDAASSIDIRGGASELYLGVTDSLCVTNANGQTSRITVKLSTGLSDDLRIFITDPIGNQEGRLNPNQHITDLLEGSMSPFINCWSYIVEGRFNLDMAIGATEGFMAGHQNYRGSTYFGTNTDIIAPTGWPLGRVDYDPTNTLDQDAMALIDDLWDEFTEVFRSLGETVSSAYDMTRSMQSCSVDFASNTLETASGILQGSIESIQLLLRNMILGGACAMIESLTDGKNIQLVSTEMLGMHLTIELNSKDPALSGARSVVKATIGFTLGECTVSISSRLFRDPSNDYSFLMNASLRSDDMKLAMIIDPFMSSYSHIMEIKGTLLGQFVDICMPEVVRYRQLEFSLADLPGIGTVLSNIPLPIPGMKGQINAGILLKLATDSASGPVINEFELNPKGKDNGKEWVEIFNPTGDVISLSGWTIETMHGKKVIDDLGEILMTPHSRFVYEFDEQALDNGEAGRLPEGESIVLRDATGKRVDTAPFVPDVKNDERTWQRAHDGSEAWEFRTCTKGGANSVTVNRWVSEDEVLSTLESIVIQTFELLEASGSSLSSLGYALQISMMNAMTALVDKYAGSIIEAGLYIEMSIVEGSGSIGSSMRYSISVDGSIFEEAWGWLCSTIMDMASNPMSAMQAVGGHGLPDFIFEEVWFGASSGLKMKVPEMFGTVQELRCSVNYVAKVNIAAAGILIGKDMGTPEMTFGVCLKGITSDEVPYLGLKVGEIVDIWMIKGTIISP